jgi:hypothetical protein
MSTKWELTEASRCSIVGQHAHGGARDGGSLTSVRAHGQPESARSYASCACIGRLGGAESGGYQPIEATMRGQSVIPSVCLFGFVSRDCAITRPMRRPSICKHASDCRRHGFVERRHKEGQIFARMRCERRKQASTKRTRASGSGDRIYCPRREGKLPRKRRAARRKATQRRGHSVPLRTNP